MSFHRSLSIDDAEPIDAAIDQQLRESMAGLLGTPRVSALAQARKVYRQRRLRARHFDARLFAEPCWDILLDLFIAAEEGRAVTVSSACIGSAAPHATALRYLGRLERAGLVQRRPHPTDSRCQEVRVTDRARHAMGDLMRDFPNAPPRARPSAQ